MFVSSDGGKRSTLGTWIAARFKFHGPAREIRRQQSWQGREELSFGMRIISRGGTRSPVIRLSDLGVWFGEITFRECIPQMFLQGLKHCVTQIEFPEAVLMLNRREKSFARLALVGHDAIETHR